MALDESLIDAQLQSLAAKLRTARFARGLRLVDVASVTGLSEVHLYRLEQGERAPSLRTLLMVAAALDLDLAELLSGDDDLPQGSAPHTGSAVWNGTEKSGSGVMIKGGVRIQYDRAYRGNPIDNADDANLGSPEALLGMAFAGCFSMALAADLGDAGFEPFRIETFAKARTEAGANGFALREIELHCEAAVSDIPQARFQTIAEQTKRNCLVSRALAAVPARLDARLVAVGEADK